MVEPLSKSSELRDFFERERQKMDLIKDWDDSAARRLGMSFDLILSNIFITK
jgi:hypothetical protein